MCGGGSVEEGNTKVRDVGEGDVAVRDVGTVDWRSILEKKKWVTE